MKNNKASAIISNMRMSRLLRSEKKYEGALICLDKVLNIYPQHHLAIWRKLELLKLLGRFDEYTLAVSDKIVQLFPSEPAAWSNKSALLRALGRHAEALDCIDKAIQLDPEKYYMWWIDRAFILANLNNKKAALESIDYAAKLYTGDSALHLSAARKAIFEILESQSAPSQ